MKKMALVSVVCTAVFVFFPVLHVGASEELTIVGTGSGTSILKAIGKAFTKQNPEVSVIVPKSIGSSGGIKAVGNDKYILGRVARDIKDKEKRYGLKHVPFAKMPIVIYVNNSVPISDITPGQVCRIFSQDVTGRDLSSTFPIRNQFCFNSTHQGEHCQNSGSCR